MQTVTGRDFQILAAWKWKDLFLADLKLAWDSSGCAAASAHCVGLGVQPSQKTRQQHHLSTSTTASARWLPTTPRNRMSSGCVSMMAPNTSLSSILLTRWLPGLARSSIMPVRDFCCWGFFYHPVDVLVLSMLALCLCIVFRWPMILHSGCVVLRWPLILHSGCVVLRWPMILHSGCVVLRWPMILHSGCVVLRWPMILHPGCVVLRWPMILHSGCVVLRWPMILC